MQVFNADSANPLRVERSTWNDEERLDLRRMFYSRAGELVPTKKGIGLSIADGTAQMVLNALRNVNGKAIHVRDAYGEVIIERREYKGVPLLDMRRFYKGAPSPHGVSLTEDIESDVLNCMAELLGIPVTEPTRLAPVIPPAKPKTTPDAAKSAERFRTLADGLENQIQDKTRPMTQNPTPKRNREYAQRLHEGANLRRCQEALRLMADAIEAGTLPATLEGVKTRQAVFDLVRTRGKSEDHYTYYDSNEYADTSEAGRALQAMLETQRDPEAERQAQIHLLENRTRLLVGQIPGFFPTPESVVRTMIGYAGIVTGHQCLEPSAGRGDIADRLKQYTDAVDVCEMHYSLREILELKGHHLVAFDFTKYQPGAHYDRIVMNPPFEKGQDVEHVMHAYELLKPGGRLVSIMGASVKFNQQRKYADFRSFLEEHDGWYEDLPADAFKESGTGVQTVLVVLDK
ncbi:MAG: methyltransferase [Anaerolineae bacterium]|nr:methyltransferase [Anaerolineae bacterium]